MTFMRKKEMLIISSCFHYDYTVGSGQLSLLIGDKGYWRKSIATEAISTITNWAFDSLGLERIQAGCYDENIGSLKALLRAGYVVEGYFRKSILLDNRRIGSFCLAILKNEVSD